MDRPPHVTRNNNHGTYWLIGPFGRCLGRAVNAHRLRPWEAPATMRPEVQTARDAEAQLRAYLYRRETVQEYASTEGAAV